MPVQHILRDLEDRDPAVTVHPKARERVRQDLELCEGLGLEHFHIDPCVVRPQFDEVGRGTVTLRIGVGVPEASGVGGQPRVKGVRHGSVDRHPEFPEDAVQGQRGGAVVRTQMGLLCVQRVGNMVVDAEVHPVREVLEGAQQFRVRHIDGNDAFRLEGLLGEPLEQVVELGRDGVGIHDGGPFPEGQQVTAELHAGAEAVPVRVLVGEDEHILAAGKDVPYPADVSLHQSLPPVRVSSSLMISMPWAMESSAMNLSSGALRRWRLRAISPRR